MANEMQTSTMLPQAGQVFAQLLEPKKAPKGDLQTDFKTALYLCAATKHYTFEEVLSQRKLDILSFMLSSVGFKGSTSNIGIEQYLDTFKSYLMMVLLNILVKVLVLLLVLLKRFHKVR